MSYFLTARCLLFAIALLCGGMPLAMAHQPYESSTNVRMDAEGMELVVTTSLEIAGLLAEEPLADAAVLQRMTAERITLYEVSADGRKLEPERVFAAIRKNEAVFSIVYPAAKPAALSFRAVYLDKLPPGYGGSLEVVDEAGNMLGMNPLLKKGEARNSLSIAVPAALAERALASAIERTPPTPGRTPWLPLVVGSTAFLLLAVLAYQQIGKT